MRLVFSIIIGLLVTLLATLIIAVVPIPWLQIFGPNIYIVPLFYGSLIGGYIAQKYWWLSGIIIGNIAEICFLLLMIMMGAANYGIVKGAETAVRMLPNMWWEIIRVILACIAGAYLGQFFARLARKKGTKNKQLTCAQIGET